jgi:signal transduction histidine kinase
MRSATQTQQRHTVANCPRRGRQRRGGSAGWRARSASCSGALIVNTASRARLGSSRPPTAARIDDAARLARALRLLAAVTRAADVPLDETTPVERVAGVLVGELADACIVDVVDDAGVLRRPVAASVEPSAGPRVRDLFAPCSEGSPIARVVATGCSLVWNDAPEAPPEVRSALASLGARSALVVPGTSRGRVAAVLSLVAGLGRPAFDAFDLALARDVACRLALALDHARAYRDARESVRARDDLVAVVSHDLRDPLSAITAGTSVLRRVAPTDPFVRRSIELLARNAERMLQLVGNLLDLARHESAGLRLELTAHAPRRLVYDAIDTLGPLAAQKGVQLEARMPAELPEVRCDRGATIRVLVNLAGNAVKFTPAGGAIRVRVEPLGGEVRFAVSDTGPGIARVDVGHVFDRYWQARRPTRSGVGLGLSIAKAIVEQTGGAIWVESHVGVGTTFFFTVPVA